MMNILAVVETGGALVALTAIFSWVLSYAKGGSPSFKFSWVDLLKSIRVALSGTLGVIATYLAVTLMPSLDTNKLEELIVFVGATIVVEVIRRFLADTTNVKPEVKKS